MQEVLDLVARHGFSRATEMAYAIRIAEIEKAWRWPNRMVTLAFAVMYFCGIWIAALVLPAPRLPARMRGLVLELARVYHYIPEIVVFKALELDAVGALPYPGRGLDLGCGNGLTASVLVKQGAMKELHGIDRSRYLAATGTYASYLIGDARMLPYASESLDFVLSLGVLDHIEEIDTVFSEVNRVLKPQGHLTFAIQTPLFRESTFWCHVYRRLGLSRKADAFKTFRDVYDMIFHYCTEDVWRKRLHAAGFSQISVGYIFGAHHLFAYDLLNMQTYFLKFFFADRAQRFFSRHRVFRRLTIWATVRVASYIVSRPANRQNATRYVIRATK